MTNRINPPTFFSPVTYKAGKWVFRIFQNGNVVEQAHPTKRAAFEARGLIRHATDSHCVTGPVFDAIVLVVQLTAQDATEKMQAIVDASLAVDDDGYDPKDTFGFN